MNDFGAGLFIGAVVTAIFSSILMLCDTKTRDYYWQNRMIKEGNATWTIDPVTGHKWFKIFPRKGGSNE